MARIAFRVTLSDLVALRSCALSEARRCEELLITAPVSERGGWRTRAANSSRVLKLVREMIDAYQASDRERVSFGLIVNTDLE